MNTKEGRDSKYRVAALDAAIKRAGQDGGIKNDPVDVLGLANVYYSWLTGNDDLKDPIVEKIKKKNKQ